MTKILVVVESPAKARKIQTYLGSKYVVKASCGHIMDLPVRRLGVDPKTFKLDIVPIKGKQKILNELKRTYKQCQGNVMLAPDPDREGEAIGYYTAKSLGVSSPYEVPRISFQEITKSAILSAMKHPKTLSESSVNAQMARRALDRILGYKLSPIVKKQTLTGTSAGRCQSPALLLLQQKEQAISEFLENHRDSKAIQGKMVGLAEGDDSPWEVVCEGLSTFPTDNWMDAEWVVALVKKGQATSSLPPPPFSTSSLLSGSASRLGYGTNKTKKMIQSMYEKGWITYIRTDSTALSKDAQRQISDYCEEELDVKVVSRDWGQKKVGSHAQEAHECIRPTLIKRLPSDIDEVYRRLYELIWNRTVASQLEVNESVVVSMDVKRKGAKKEETMWRGSKSYCVRAGWKQIEGVAVVKQSDIPVPKKGGHWEPNSLQIEEVVKSPPRRFNDATFVAALEKVGIGRPSTYATIVETIQARGYAEVKDIDGECVACRSQTHIPNTKVKLVEKRQTVGQERRRLCLTDLGRSVCEFLYPMLEDLLGIQATSSMESQLDEICRGEKSYEDIMRNYWKKLQEMIGRLSECLPQKSLKSDVLGVQTIDGTKYHISVQVTRFGPAVVRVLASDPTKKEYGNIPKGVDVSKLMLEDALAYMPVSLGKWNKESIVAKQGKYGPYLQIGKSTYVSIPQQVWDGGITPQKALTILKMDEKEKGHVAMLQKKLGKKGVASIQKGPRGWYVKMKQGRNKSLGDSILDKSVDDVSVAVGLE